MRKKILIIFMTLISVICLAFGLSACNFGSNSGGGSNSGNIEQNGGGEENNGGDNESSGGNEQSGGNSSGDQTTTEPEKTSGSTGLEYTLSDDGEYYICTGIGTCVKSEIEIASWYEDKWVTSIGGSAFRGCDSITSITIPDSITTIGGSAFYGCTSLAGVAIGKGVTLINDYAFYECTSLTRISYNATKCSTSNGRSHNYIFYNAGKNGNGITVTIGANVENIPGGLFSPYNSTNPTLYSPKIVSVVFANNSVCTNIEIEAFRHCVSLTSITIPDSVTTIGQSAFGSCTGLKNVTIGSGVTSMAAWVFDNCTGLTSVTIKDGATSIGWETFYGCTSLKSITIPDSVTAVGSGEFYNCTSLTSVKIGNGVTSIGVNAFYGCNSLVSITLPFVGGSASATSASSSTLFGYIFGTSSYTGGISTKQYYANSSYTTYYIPTSLKTVTITGGEIFYGAFYNCTGLTSITIPDSVTSIGTSAFKECTSLTSVTIGSGVTLISERAFYDCTSLTSITIPDSVTSIGSYAFYNCTSLTGVTFKNTSGWWVSTSSSATSGISVTVTNASTAATYLTSTYYNYSWKRS